jgi:hypothetical protein
MNCHGLGDFSATKQGVRHTVTFPFTLKSILMQKEEL